MSQCNEYSVTSLEQGEKLKHQSCCSVTNVSSTRTRSRTSTFTPSASCSPVHSRGSLSWAWRTAGRRGSSTAARRRRVQERWPSHSPWSRKRRGGLAGRPTADIGTGRPSGSWSACVGTAAPARAGHRRRRRAASRRWCRRWSDPASRREGWQAWWWEGEGGVSRYRHAAAAAAPGSPPSPPHSSPRWSPAEGGRERWSSSLRAPGGEEEEERKKKKKRVRAHPSTLLQTHRLTHREEEEEGEDRHRPSFSRCLVESYWWQLVTWSRSQAGDWPSRRRDAAERRGRWRDGSGRRERWAGMCGPNTHTYTHIYTHTHTHTHTHARTHTHTASQQHHIGIVGWRWFWLAGVRWSWWMRMSKFSGSRLFKCTFVGFFYVFRRMNKYIVCFGALYIN